jgi:hypothetical protein
MGVNPKVKLTRLGAPELPIVGMRRIFASVGAFFSAKHAADVHRRGIVLGSHLGANRPAFRRAAVTVGRTGPLAALFSSKT